MKNTINIKLNNVALKNDLNEILENNYEVSKGTVSGNSIEMVEGNSLSSYTYYGKEKERDEDLKTIEELLENK